MIADFEENASKLIAMLQARGWRLALAESCTGGLLAKKLTDFPGSSAWFEASLVTYSNAAKIRLLGVSEATLAKHGAVSEVTALEMAQGALARTGADLAISITGIAGPNGGSVEKPVGLVWFGYAQGGIVKAVQQKFSGTRAEIREQAAAYAAAWVC